MLNRIFLSVFPTVTLSALLSAIAVLPLSHLAAIAQIPQESNEATQATKRSTTAIAPEKRALIKELLEITESTKNAQQVMEAMMRSELPKLVSTVLQNNPALDSDRPEVQQQFNNIVSRMASKYRDRVIQKINVDQLIEQVSYPIYDQYFTESELRDIIGFYKSSTGKKAISVLPQIVGDSMSRTNEILLPQLSSIMTEIITEEIINAVKK
jgi:hypothetical protein